MTFWKAFWNEFEWLNEFFMSKLNMKQQSSHKNQTVTLLVENINYCMTLTNFWTSTYNSNFEGFPTGWVGVWGSNLSLAEILLIVHTVHQVFIASPPPAPPHRHPRHQGLTLLH